MNEIKQALVAGVESEDFHRLLVNFGLWSRGIGAPRYVSPGSIGVASGGGITPVITDESALVIDQCLVRLKALNALGYWMFSEYYMHCQSCTDIALQMRDIGRRRHDLVLKNATSKAVKEILEAFIGKLVVLLEEKVRKNEKDFL